MISSQSIIQTNQKISNPSIKNNENINENETENIFFQENDIKNEKIAKNHQSINKIKKQPLKNIENIISNNINKNVNKISANTAIKQSKSFLDNNIYKTLTKQNFFNSFNYSTEEKYSLLKMKKIKSNKFSPYKSTNHLYNKVENAFDEEKNDSKYLYFKLKKHKKINSLKKAYISHITFEDRKNENKDFKLFRDCDIGLNDGNKVKKQFEDFDVDSDDDVIENGVKKCFQNLETAIDFMKNRNEEYVGKYMKKFENY